MEQKACSRHDPTGYTEFRSRYLARANRRHMTQEDLDQIRSRIGANNQVIEAQTRSLISANNQVLFEAMRAIEEHVDQSIGRLRDELGGRLAHIERRLDCMEARFTAFEFQLALRYQWRHPALLPLCLGGTCSRRAGYPERFAQEALGHNSKAVHRAYAKKAEVRIDLLDQWEKKMKEIGRASCRE